MKVAQNDETNPDTQPVRSPHIPNLSNSQLSPSGSFDRKRETPGILSRMFPPSPVSPIPALDHPWHRILPRYVLWCFACSVFTLSPPLLSGRPRDCRWCRCDQLHRRRPLLARATRQAPPLIIPISPILFSHACIRFCYCNWLLLFWCIAWFCNLQLLPYLLILNCLV